MISEFADRKRIYTFTLDFLVKNRILKNLKGLHNQMPMHTNERPCAVIFTWISAFFLINMEIFCYYIPERSYVFTENLVLLQCSWLLELNI